MISPRVRYKRLPAYRGPKAPFRAAYTGDAGFDVYSTLDFSLLPGQRLTVGTGIAIALPEGVEAQVRPKSGLSSVRGITVLNSPGTIDPPYRGEVGVILQNTSQAVTTAVMDSLFDFLEGNAEISDLHNMFDRHVADTTQHFKAGDKLAQLVFAEFLTPEFEEVDELDDTVRGAAGYGSSGK
jgi:dUTP pyrophosphatase